MICHDLSSLSVSVICHLYVGLNVERARVPGARSFAFAHGVFASCVPSVNALVSLLFLFISNAF